MKLIFLFLLSAFFMYSPIALSNETVRVVGSNNSFRDIVQGNTFATTNNFVINVSNPNEVEALRKLSEMIDKNIVGSEVRNASISFNKPENKMYITDKVSKNVISVDCYTYEKGYVGRLVSAVAPATNDQSCNH